jgi:hypothetical protein
MLLVVPGEDENPVTEAWNDQTSGLFLLKQCYEKAIDMECRFFER